MYSYPHSEFTKRLDVLTSLVKPLADLNLAAGADALDQRLTQVIEEVTNENINLKDLNEELHCKIDNLESRLEELEKQAHKKTILIRGVPHIPRRTHKEVFSTMCKLIDFPFKFSKDVENFKQIPMNPEDKCSIKTYVVDFMKKCKKDEFLKASNLKPLKKKEIVEYFEEEDRRAMERVEEPTPEPPTPEPEPPAPPPAKCFEAKEYCWRYMGIDNEKVILLCYEVKGRMPPPLFPIVDQGIMDGPPLDLTFRNLSEIAEAKSVDLQNPPNRYKLDKVTGKVQTRSIRLSNNNLTSLRGLSELVEFFVQCPEEVAWIDVSFNKLVSIEKELLSFPNLRILYLHGNNIPSLSEVTKLECLQFLRSVTLHGNPFETEPYYRAKVLGALPRLRVLDFSDVTDHDREVSAHYTCKAKLYKSKK